MASTLDWVHLWVELCIGFHLRAELLDHRWVEFLHRVHRWVELLHQFHWSIELLHRVNWSIELCIGGA